MFILPDCQTFKQRWKYKNVAGSPSIPHLLCVLENTRSLGAHWSQTSSRWLFGRSDHVTHASMHQTTSMSRASSSSSSVLSLLFSSIFSPPSSMSSPFINLLLSYFSLSPSSLFLSLSSSIFSFSYYSSSSLSSRCHILVSVAPVRSHVGTKQAHV